MTAIPNFVGSIGRTFRGPRDVFRPRRPYAAGEGLASFRESSPRPTSLPIELRLPGWPAARTLWAEIGVNGFFVALPEPPGVGTFVRYHVPAVEHRGLGEVVWIRVRPNQDGPAGIGVELGNLDYRTRCALALLVAEPC